MSIRLWLRVVFCVTAIAGYVLALFCGNNLIIVITGAGILWLSVAGIVATA
jgi:hypothetical protein